MTPATTTLRANMTAAMATLRVNTTAAMAMASWSAITTILTPIPPRFIVPKSTTTIITTTAAIIVIPADAIRTAGATRLLPAQPTASQVPTSTAQTTIITGTLRLRTPTTTGVSGNTNAMMIGMKADNTVRTIRTRTGNGSAGKIGIGKKPNARTGALKNFLLIGPDPEGKILASRLSKISRRGNKAPGDGAIGIEWMITAANNSRFAWIKLG